jgi:hypothetical protein
MDLTNFGLQVLAGLSPILISLAIALLGFGLNFLKKKAKEIDNNVISNYALEVIKNNIGSLEYYLEDLLEAKLVEMKDGQVITEIKGISNPNLSSQ